LLDRHRGANYKILSPDPIGLPRHRVFSTSARGFMAAGHGGPDANARPTACALN